MLTAGWHRVPLVVAWFIVRTQIQPAILVVFSAHHVTTNTVVLCVAKSVQAVLVSSASPASSAGIVTVRLMMCMRVNQSGLMTWFRAQLPV